MSNCKHFPNADDHCLVCEAEENRLRAAAIRPGAESGVDLSKIPTVTHTEVEFMGDVEAFPNEPEAPRAPFWTVAIYLVDQAYGGPEEGGWWYQCGERIDQAIDGLDPTVLLQVTFDEERAYRYAEMAQERLDATVNVGRRDISSVLSTGRYNAQVYNGHPPAHYPERKPHYE